MPEYLLPSTIQPPKPQDGKELEKVGNNLDQIERIITRVASAIEILGTLKGKQLGQNKSDVNVIEAKVNKEVDRRVSSSATSGMTSQAVSKTQTIMYDCDAAFKDVVQILTNYTQAYINEHGKEPDMTQLLRDLQDKSNIETKMTIIDNFFKKHTIVQRE